MRFLVTGKSGQLGHDVCRLLASRGAVFFAPDSAELDVTDGDAVAAVFARCQPDAVVHCAAYTAVDRAESQRERCFAVNEGGTRRLALACRETGAKLLYVSTDYVFSGVGERPWETEDETLPLNVYGESKLAGERAARETLSRCFVVRTSWVFGKNGQNFPKAMARLGRERERLGVVCDQVGAPTYTVDLAPLLLDMLATERYGLYHAAGAGVCSRAELAREVLTRTGSRTQVEDILTADYPAAARRPLNSRLGMRSLDEGGFCRLPDWRDALGRFLAEEEREP